MKCLASIVTCVPLIVGCSTDAPNSRPAQSVDLNEVDSITLVAWELTLDGGTSTLGAVTDDGYLCSIRLNQHVLAGEFPLDAAVSPGRLFFEDSLIEVRSLQEKRLIDLLQSATIALVELEDPRRLAQTVPVDFDTIKALAVEDVTLAVEDDDNLLDRSRDEIVAFVLSDEYVDIARNGLPGTDSG